MQTTVAHFNAVILMFVNRFLIAFTLFVFLFLKKYFQFFANYFSNLNDFYKYNRHNKCLFCVKFNGDSKYLGQFVHKLNLAYIQLLSSLYAMTKNPIPFWGDNLTIFSFCLDRIGSFCREFKYLPHLCKIICVFLCHLAYLLLL